MNEPVTHYDYETGPLIPPYYSLMRWWDAADKRRKQLEREQLNKEKHANDKNPGRENLYSTRAN